MAVRAVATLARGTDPAALAHETVSRLRAAVGSQPVRAGVLYASGVPHTVVSTALASMLPGVEILGATVAEAGPSLAGLWLAGDVRAVVTVRLRPDQSGRELAEAAVARAGFKAFQTRLAILHSSSCAGLLGELFEMLPKGAAFLGADVAEVWTEAGTVGEGLLLADWEPKVVVGFEAPMQVLERKGLTPESCVGMLRLRTGEAAEAMPEALAQVPQVAAQVRAIYGVPDRSPLGSATGTLVLSNLKDRSEGR